MMSGDSEAMALIAAKSPVGADTSERGTLSCVRSAAIAASARQMDASGAPFGSMTQAALTPVSDAGLTALARTGAPQTDPAWSAAPGAPCRGTGAQTPAPWVQAR